MYEKEVARGARWLDEQAPGWELRIDSHTLDMSRCSSCIIGQVWGLEQIQYYASYEQFNSILARGDILCGGGAAFGFNIISDEHEICESENHCKHWDGLAQAWVAEVKRRLDEGVSI